MYKNCSMHLHEIHTQIKNGINCELCSLQCSELLVV